MIKNLLSKLDTNIRFFSFTLRYHWKARFLLFSIEIVVSFFETLKPTLYVVSSISLTSTIMVLISFANQPCGHCQSL